MKKISAQTKKHLLTFAEQQAKRHGQRWTNTRIQVYEALLDFGQPISAYQLMDEVARCNDRSVKPASVYRSLEALIAMGLVAKIESLNTFVACEHPDHDHQHVFLVCDNCGQVGELADQGISGQLAKGAALKGFKASRQVLELHGDCQTCRE
jgi:Fur family zinc uptake transcriptional regulator